MPWINGVFLVILVVLWVGIPAGIINGSAPLWWGLVLVPITIACSRAVLMVALWGERAAGPPAVRLQRIRVSDVVAIRRRSLLSAGSYTSGPQFAIIHRSGIVHVPDVPFGGVDLIEQLSARNPDIALDEGVGRGG